MSITKMLLLMPIMAIMSICLNADENKMEKEDNKKVGDIIYIYVETTEGAKKYQAEENEKDILIRNVSEVENKMSLDNTANNYYAYLEQQGRIINARKNMLNEEEYEYVLIGVMRYEDGAGLIAYRVFEKDNQIVTYIWSYSIIDEEANQLMSDFIGENLDARIGKITELD